jgi:serine protease Do
VGLDDDEPIASTLYDSPFSTRRSLVGGLAEERSLEIVSQGGEAAASVKAPSIADSAFAGAIELARQRTVKVFGAGIGRNAGYASGIVISATGQILTAQGAFLSADNLRVTMADGRTHAAKVVRRSSELQAALLQIDAATPEFFDLSTLPTIVPGDWVLAVSNAFKVAEGREPLSVNSGVLSRRAPIDARRGLLDFPYQADAYLYDAITSNPGAEGGAVVTADAQLVGMIGRVIESKGSGTRLNYAVPADVLAKFVHGESAPASAATASASAKADLGLRLFSLGGRRGPAYIDRISTGGPAAAAGLKTDDLIVSIGGHVVRDASDLRRILETLPVGVEVAVAVKRKNELITVRLVPVAER